MEKFIFNVVILFATRPNKNFTYVSMYVCICVYIHIHTRGALIVGLGIKNILYWPVFSH